MTDDLPPADSVRDGDEGISAADERAMHDLFASLVADAPASKVSPLDVVRLGRREARDALDTRIHRFKVLRNVLVAAAFAAVAALTALAAAQPCFAFTKRIMNSLVVR